MSSNLEDLCSDPSSAKRQVIVSNSVFLGLQLEWSARQVGLFETSEGCSGGCPFLDPVDRVTQVFGFS